MIGSRPQIIMSTDHQITLTPEALARLTAETVRQSADLPAGKRQREEELEQEVSRLKRKIEELRADNDELSNQVQEAEVRRSYTRNAHSRFMRNISAICAICQEPWGDERQLFRFLDAGCDHLHCAECAQSLMDIGDFRCSICRAEFTLGRGDGAIIESMIPEKLVCRPANQAVIVSTPRPGLGAIPRSPSEQEDGDEPEQQ